jgi:hypothetical protein
MNILPIIVDFTNNVEDSKIGADEARQRIPEIRQLIVDAERQTKSNQLALTGAKDAASKALIDADEAKSIADKASMVRKNDTFCLKLPQLCS